MEKKFIIEEKEFTLTCADDVLAELSLVEKRDGITLYKIYFKWEKSCSPEMVTLSYSIPCVDIYTMWDPIEKLRAIPFGNKQITDSRLGNGMPVKSVVSKSGRNRYLMMVSDVKSPINERMKASTSKATVDCAIDFFTSLTGPFESYEAIIRVDERDIPFDRAIYDAKKWFDSLGYKSPYVPDDAKRPMYSTWYSYGQGVTAADVIKECERAAGLGMRTVILDDGWQTENTKAVYGYCGDWKPVPKKFPDMRELSDKLHALGMKLMVWYSVPFVGLYSERFKEFEGKYLRFLENANCYVLDPRYKEVRDFLVNTYATAVKEWKLDGLKLDFIDRFKTNGEYNEDMDFVSVEDATEQLLEDISAALKAIDPEILIEFRQPYYGPVVSKYGNMMRVWDCPLDGCMNKTQSINLRLVSGKCAVHSDMIYWHKEDTPESVALQLWGTVFSVPQISAHLWEITDEQTAVLKNYLDFWNEHRDTLMDGQIRTKLCENGYGYAETTCNRETVAILSSAPVMEISDSERYYVVNLTDSESVIIKNPEKKKLRLTVKDCMGRELESLDVTDRLAEINIPLGGMAMIG